MWLAVNIGHSRQHWGWFSDNELVLTADYPLDYWNEQATYPAERIVVASVKGDCLPRWQALARTHVLSVDQVPLAGKYFTLAVDRALNLVGAADSYGLPALVVDFGAAITLSGIDERGEFIGGCILPGFGSQLHALRSHTANLPEITLPDTLPPFLALSTELAVQSGVLHVTLAGIEQVCQQWLRQYATSVTVATGFDSELVYRWLPHLFDVQDAHLGLWGIFATEQFRSRTGGNGNGRKRTRGARLVPSLRP
jgi:type III pantothenate kinase